MSISNALANFLDDKKVAYTVISHSQAYTAQETAASIHLPGKKMAKSIVLKVNGGFAMVVLPASYKIDFDRLGASLRKEKISLATEEEFSALFPDCEIGAMPPFGNLYDIPVYIAQSLEEDSEIAFNAGSHTEVIRMSLDDYKRLVKPQTVKISDPV